MNKNKSNFKYYLSFLPILLVFLDQITKYFARRELGAKNRVISIIPKVLSFHYLENRGAVWGIMQGRYGLLTIITFIILMAFIIFMIRIPHEKRYFPLYFVSVFIVSGAVGNLIDRIGFGFVTDFIYFEIIDFPIFNVADIYVTCSVIALAFLILFYYKDEELKFMTLFNDKNITNDES